MKNSFFTPTEIIFASTTACNLKCVHCFVSRAPIRLQTEDAIRFLKSAKESDNCTIEKIGFSGGEPFLYKEFFLEIIKEALSMDFMFDRIMTNGVWWQDEEELKNTLQALYDAGFDGKIGLSWDYFHGQDFKKIEIFVKNVLSIFGGESLEIQSVVPFDIRDTDFVKKADDQILKNLKALSETLGLTIKKYTKAFKKTGQIILSDGGETFIRVFRTPETFPCSDGRGWKSRKWFKEDYCAGPGQILYVHSSGKIAPCCGFANENNRLIIGNLKMSYDEVLVNAEANPLLKVCFQTGLSEISKRITKEGSLSRKTDDPCTFCDYVCKYNLV